jgi:hypothetical protein
VSDKDGLQHTSIGSSDEAAFPGVPITDEDGDAT